MNGLRIDKNPELVKEARALLAGIYYGALDFDRKLKKTLFPGVTVELYKSICVYDFANSIWKSNTWLETHFPKVKTQEDLKNAIRRYAHLLDLISKDNPLDNITEDDREAFREFESFAYRFEEKMMRELGNFSRHP